MLMPFKKPIIKIITTIKHLRVPDFSYLSFDIVKVGPGAVFGGFAYKRPARVPYTIPIHCFFFNLDFKVICYIIIYYLKRYFVLLAPLRL